MYHYTVNDVFYKLTPKNYAFLVTTFLYDIFLCKIVIENHTSCFLNNTSIGQNTGLLSNCTVIWVPTYIV